MKPQLALSRSGSAFGRERRRGASVIEFALLCPWYLFLFIGSFDLGLYSYALISVENAARVAALACSVNAAACSTSWTSSAACTLALAQLTDLPNAPASCSTSPTPLSGTVAYTTAGGPDGGPTVTITVDYTMPALSGIPNLLPGQYTVVRSVLMRVRT
jgi:Flp pilus assembly protein TadG